MVKGSAGYVLPRFNDKVYFFIEEGTHFGHLDLAGDRYFVEDDMGNYTRKAILEAEHIRRFTVQAFDNCELLGLTLSDLLKMKYEFPKFFKELFDGSRDKLRKDLVLKFEVIKLSEISSIQQPRNKSEEIKSKFATLFMGQILQQMNHAKN